MYTPPAFKVDDPMRIRQLIRDYPFALLISANSRGLETTHLPCLLDTERGPHGTLLAHMARANPHWQDFDGRREALAVFTGPHAYVSPSWYQNPVTVPTWNYVAVHVHGRPVIVHDKQRVRALLDQLVAEHESHRDPAWSTALANEYVIQQLNHIVAFEMEITRLEGQFKLSQNRSREDQEGVISALCGSENSTVRELAELMHQNLKQ